MDIFNIIYIHLKFKKNKIYEVNKIQNVISENSFSNNLLVTLFFVFFIVIAIDIGSELAAQKDEIGTTLCVLEEGYTELILTIDFLPDIERPLLYEIAFNNFSPSENIRKSSVTDRGPPVTSL